MLRFVIVVPITIVGLVLLVARYGGLGRAARSARGGRRERRRRPSAAPRRPRRRVRAPPGARELLAWARAGRRRARSLRLIELGDRPFHHDESQDAYFSWLFRQSGDYEYNPLLHGPLRFYLTAADVRAVRRHGLHGAARAGADGHADGPALLRCCARQLGRVARVRRRGRCSRSARRYLYFSRFAREDIYVACITLALLVVIFRFLDRPRRYHPALIGALLALSFATKETTFITVFVIGTFFLARARASRLARAAGLGPGARASAWRRWGWALAAFAGVFTLLFTTFLTHPAGLWDGIYTGLDYWLGQHERRPRRRAAVLLRRRAVRRSSGRRCCSARSAPSSRSRRPTLLRAVPDLGLRALARRLLVGGREVRLARAAPAAAAAAARRRRRAGDLGDARARWPASSALVAAALALALRRLRLVVGQRRARRRPARVPRLHAVLDAGQGRRRPGARAGRRAAGRASRR